jgi:hypothetical protein
LSFTLSPGITSTRPSLSRRSSSFTSSGPRDHVALVDVVGLPIVEHEVEHPEEPGVLREDLLLLDGHLVGGGCGSARELGELEEVDLEQLADLLEALQREGVLGEQALHAGLGQSQARSERPVGHPTGFQQLLQGFHEGGGLRIAQGTPSELEVSIFDTTR